MATQTRTISLLLIALIWVSFFASLFVPFIANVSTNYNSTFDEEDISTYNRLADLNANVSELQESTLGYKEKTGALDILGDFFSSSYKTLKLSFKSINIFTDMTYDAMSSSAFNIPAMQNLKVSLVLTVIILLIMGVILKAVIKSDV